MATKQQTRRVHSPLTDTITTLQDLTSARAWPSWRARVEDMLAADGCKFLMPARGTDPAAVPTEALVTQLAARLKSLHKLSSDADARAEARDLQFAYCALLRSTLASDWYAVVADAECPTALIAALEAHAAAESAKAAALAAKNKSSSSSSLGGVKAEKVIPLILQDKNNAFNHAELTQLVDQLCGSLLDRDEAVRVLLLSVLSGQNVLLLGPPGTAKSYAVNETMKRIVTPRPHFSTTLHATSTVDDLIGPIDVQSLTTVSVSQRNLGGMLADTELAFLDEIFKASKATLSCLMTILNERRIANGSTMVDTPLHVCFGASNEVPLEASQAALMDRFPLRVFVDYVSPTTRLALLGFLGTDTSSSSSPVLRINLGDVADVSKRAQALGNVLADPAMLALFTDLHEYINGALLREAEYRAAGPPPATAASTSTSTASTGVRKGGSAWMDSLFAGGKSGVFGAQSQQTYGGWLLTDRGIVVLLKVLRVVVFAHGRTKANPLDVYPVVYVAWQTKDQHQCLVQWLEARLAKELAALAQIKGRDAVAATVKAHLFVPDAAKQRILNGFMGPAPAVETKPAPVAESIKPASEPVAIASPVAPAAKPAAAPASPAPPAPKPVPTPVAPVEVPVPQQHQPVPVLNERQLTIESMGLNSVLKEHGLIRVTLGSDAPLINIGGLLWTNTECSGIHIISFNAPANGAPALVDHWQIEPHTETPKSIQRMNGGRPVNRVVDYPLEAMLNDMTHPERAPAGRVVAIAVFEDASYQVRTLYRDAIHAALGGGSNNQIGSLGYREGFAGAVQLRAGAGGKVERVPLGQVRSAVDTIAKLECKIRVP
ncbi:hypothetical protein H9P43_002783 [Blastocladiella emersonii ATCC 22665]|nr:hypothetical protein H9P43_002783 [Blastocladiella emersonii ATCC 22665]